MAVLNGPNRNLLGTREPELYGSALPADLALGVVAGFGAQSYFLGLDALVTYPRARGG